MTKVESNRAELEKKYEKWITELDESFFGEEFSNPYLISIPDNWYDSEIRIMIVGEEGFGKWGAGKADWRDGKDEWSPKNPEGLRNIIEYNKDYCYTQLVAKKKYKGYDYNRSKFWNRVRKINELGKYSIIWNNIDKIHLLQYLSCKLKSPEREKLHSTSTKILAEEMNLLKPTHVFFLGWHDTSLQAELPEIFLKLCPAGMNDTSLYFKNVVTIKENDITFVFSYHPGWRGKDKPADYDEQVMNAIKASL